MAAGVTAINVLPREYAEDCRIKDSVAVPFADLSVFVSAMPRDVELVVYCARYSCSLSRDAYALLKKMGFTRIAAYEGGMQEWFQKGFPTDGACALDYLKKPIEKAPKHGGDIVVITAEELRAKLRV
jgi:rhodanese-related sulfurtransferase